MSENDVVFNNGQQAIINTDLTKIFVWNNRYNSDNYVNNSSYDPITVPAGTVMGRIATSGVLIPLASDASDGSQYPYGILASDMVVESGDTVKATVCVGGDVAAEKVIFAKPGDNLNTVVDGRQLRDRIGGDTVGIKLVTSDQNTGFDNQ